MSPWEAGSGRTGDEAAGGDELGNSWPSFSAGSDPPARRVPRRLQCRLPHPHHEVGGMVFPQDRDQSVAAARALRPRLRSGRTISWPSFPPAIYLTHGVPTWGDVSQGKFGHGSTTSRSSSRGILERQGSGRVFRLPSSASFHSSNSTPRADRKTEKPEGKLGVTCFDCHVNGHTSGAAHLVGDIPAAVAPPPDRDAEALARPCTSSASSARKRAPPVDRGTSRSSSSARRISTATTSQHRPRGVKRSSKRGSQVPFHGPEGPGATSPFPAPRAGPGD